MATRANVTFRLGLVLAGLCLVVAPITTAQAQPLQVDCLAALHADLESVLPGGLSCTGQWTCSTAAPVSAAPSHTWIDAGTGVLSTEEASDTSQVITSNAWIDAGTAILSEAPAGDACAQAQAIPDLAGRALAAGADERIARRELAAVPPTLPSTGSAENRLASTLGLAGTSATFPATLALPTGFTPEGIAVGRGTSFYVGSLSTGAVFRGDLRTGQGSLLVQPIKGRAEVGMKVDRRTNYLFVAGGPSGQLYVYDAGTGRQVAMFQLATGDTLINDLIITPRAVYVTDSFRKYFYVLPLGPEGQLPDQAAVKAIPLGGDFTSVFVPPPGFNLNSNGIAATPDGMWLIIVHSLSGKLFRVNAQTGYAVAIDLNGANVQWGDGILFNGPRLYVVRNTSQVSVVSFNGDYTAGTVRTFDNNQLGGVLQVPSTGAALGNALYVVNARYDIAPAGQPAPNVSFNVVRIAFDELNSMGTN